MIEELFDLIALSVNVDKSSIIGTKDQIWLENELLNMVQSGFIAPPSEVGLARIMVLLKGIVCER